MPSLLKKAWDNLRRSVLVSSKSFAGVCHRKKSELKIETRMARMAGVRAGQDE